PVEARNALGIARQATVHRLASEQRWPEVGATMSTSLSVSDHRVEGPGKLSGRSAWLDYFRQEISGGTRFALRDVLALDLPRGAAMIEGSVEGVFPGGGPFEVRLLLVQTVDADGNLAVLELFDPSQQALAFARFDDLVTRLEMTTADQRANAPANFES